MHCIISIAVAKKKESSPLDKFTKKTTKTTGPSKVKITDENKDKEREA